MTAAEDREADQSRIDPSIVAALYVEHADELRAFLIGVLRDRDLAGEALQSCFAKAVEMGHTARQETLKGWLFRVAFHEALAIRRKQKRQQKSVGKLIENHREGGRSVNAADSPQASLVRGELVQEVRSALGLLPAEQQEIVRQRIYEQKTFAVIAEELKLPLGTVLTRMRLAMQKLKEKLKHSADE